MLQALILGLGNNFLYKYDEISHRSSCKMSSKNFRIGAVENVDDYGRKHNIRDKNNFWNNLRTFLFCTSVNDYSSIHLTKLVEISRLNSKVFLLSGVS